MSEYSDNSSRPPTPMGKGKRKRPPKSQASILERDLDLSDSSESSSSTPRAVVKAPRQAKKDPPSKPHAADASSTCLASLTVICTEPSPPGGKLRLLSPATKAREIKALVGDISELRVLRSGDLLFELKTQDQVHALLPLTKFAGIPVKFYTPRNASRLKFGVISGFPPATPAGELSESLAAAGITEFARLNRRTTDGSLTPTWSIKVGFQQELPEYIIVDYVKFPVRPYTPRPLQCYRCHRYGHGSQHCKSAERCGRCGDPGHSTKSCTAAAPCCPLCKGAHPAWSPDCHLRALATSTEKLRNEKGISYTEARRLAGDQLAPPPHTRSYASVAASRPLPPPAPPLPPASSPPAPSAPSSAPSTSALPPRPSLAASLPLPSPDLKPLFSAIAPLVNPLLDALLAAFPSPTLSSFIALLRAFLASFLSSPPT